MNAPATFLILIQVSLCAPAFGQASSSKPMAQMPASARQLIAIKVTGSKRFPEDAIAASTGLPLGAPVGEEDFKKAAQRLGATGAFTDIAYTYSYSSAGTKLDIKVTDADKFVPARFEDFVWFSDAEMRQRIKEHLPLFDGQLPLSGRMADEVSDVLQAMLVEKSIPGHVDYVRGGKPDGPVESIDYKVSNVLIRIRKIQFEGSGDLTDALEAAAQRAGNLEYSQSRLDLLIKRDLLPVYYSRGYLKAAFSQPHTKAVEQLKADTIEEGPRNQTMVDVSFSVTPGLQYRLKSLHWSGNREFPTEQLDKMVRAQVGQPANTVHLSRDLQPVQTLYGSRGFITAKIKTDADFDDTAGTVVLVVDINEGFAYHMGELQFRGLDNSLTAKLRDAWKLRAGEVYNASYLEEYLPLAQKLLPVNFDWDVEHHVTANIHDKTVDVDLVYSVKAPK